MWRWIDGLSEGQAIEILSDEEKLPSAEPEEVYCPMASRACFANGKEVAWCLTCPHISEGDRELVKKAVEGSQPKTGRWIDAVIPNDNGGLPVQVCDQCNTFFPLAYTGGGHNFCPHCGADMRGGKNDKR